MKKIDAIYAVITKRDEKKWSINKVIACRFYDGQIVSDEDEIIKMFPENGHIITFQTFHGKNELLLDLDDLVEIPVREIRPIEAEGQLIRVDHDPMLKKNCFEVIEMPFALFSGGCFKLDEIDKNIKDKNFRFGTSELYLSIASEVYGPFKLINGKIEPKLGKDVLIYRFNPESMVSYLGDNYLLEKPKNEIGRADCMSPGQLMDWVKDKIKVYGNYNGEINNIIKLLKKTASPDSELERVRYSRALSTLESIELSIADIEQLFSETSTWNHVFQKCFVENESEFRNRHLQKMEEEFKTITKKHTAMSMALGDSIIMQENKISEKSEQYEELIRIIEEKSRELSAIEQRRDELILNIRIQANSGTSSATSVIEKTKLLQTYEIRELRNSYQGSFETIDDYLDELKERFGFTADKRRLFEASLPILFQKRFLLGSNVNFVLALIQSLGNANLCLQQAEIDWIKFSQLYPKGLDQIIDSAEANPALPHYFILQDFNLPSFECYGKPLIDLADGIRIMVPGTDRPWPPNLNVILIPVTITDAEFGFKIYKETYRSWGILPFTTESNFGHHVNLTNTVDFIALESSLDTKNQGNIDDYTN